MAHYVDGFVFPIARSRLDDYAQLSEAIADIWREHGALDYQEYVGDDMTLEGTRSFSDLVEAGADDVIVFGWVTFDSQATRDRANEKVAADPRVADLMAASKTGFDAKRMAYGGFQPLVSSLAKNS